MSISSDEVNYLIYRYLQENGFSHSAFVFAYESLVAKSTVAQSDVPPGALITFLQKGLEYVGIEEHIGEDGSLKEYDASFSLLSPFVCDAIATKEDRRVRRAQNATVEASSSSSVPMKVEEPNGADDADHKNGVPPIPTAITLKSEDDLRYLQLTGHQGEVFSCVWNPVLAQLASGSSDGMCRLWGLAEMTKDTWMSDESEIPLRTAILPHSAYAGERFKDVTSVSWSPDGQFLATGCYDGIVRIWDEQGNLKTVLKEHTGPVFSLKWTKSGNYILSGSYDRRSIVWCPKTGAIIKSFVLHSTSILDLDWKDSETFATCSSDMAIHVCNLKAESTQAVRTFLGHTGEVNAVCWSPGGMYLASCSDDGTAKIWSMEEGGETGLKHDLKGHTKEIYTVRWTPTGPGSANPDKPLLLCTASFDGTVRVWSAETGETVYNLRRHAQPVYSIAPSPTGDYIATGSLGGFVSIWSLKDGSLVHESKGGGDAFDVSWSHDSTMVSACFSSGVLQVLDFASVLAHSKHLSANANGSSSHASSSEGSSSPKAIVTSPAADKHSNGHGQNHGHEGQEKDGHDEASETVMMDAEEVEVEAVSEEAGEGNS